MLEAILEHHGITHASETEDLKSTVHIYKNRYGQYWLVTTYNGELDSVEIKHLNRLTLAYDHFELYPKDDTHD